MKSNELRIGNYVLFNKSNNEIGCITSVETFVSNQFKVGFDNRIDIKYYDDEIKPIPLTEEWLLKFGFRIGKTEEYYELEFVEMFGYDNEDWNFKYLGNLIKLDLKYVHSLQNLYFALTGEELTIKKKDEYKKQ
jgi:hypothetical protein